MANADNPYQPPTENLQRVEFDHKLRFKGVIEPADYLNLFPVNRRESTVWLVLGLLIGLTALPICVIALVTAISSSRRFDVLPMLLLFLTLTFLSVYYCAQKVRFRARAERALAKYPDLLGVAVGEVTSDGLWFNDGYHQYWFGPSYMMRAVSLPAGLRVPVDDDQLRYLALTARLFESYSLRAMNLLRLGWFRAGITDQPELMSQRLGAEPTGAIHFRFVTPYTVPGQESASRGILLVNFVAQLLLVFVGTMTWSTIGKWIVIGIGFSWLMMIVSRLPMVKRIARGVSELTQVGWVSEQEFAMYNSVSAVRMPLNELKLVRVSEELVTVNLPSGAFPISRQSLTNPADWPRLWERSVPS